MKPFSQKDERWKDLTIGKTNCTMGKYGCFVVALSSLMEQEPNITLEALNAGNAFDSKGLLLSDVAARVLNLRFKGKTNSLNLAKEFCKKNGSPWVVCETDHYKEQGYDQHFFLYNIETKEAMDPLDGKVKPNSYKIVSYRLFAIKKSSIGLEKSSMLDIKPELSALCGQKVQHAGHKARRTVSRKATRARQSAHEGCGRQI